jgi:O-acetylserine/cysteine efflux transporter
MPFLAIVCVLFINAVFGGAYVFGKIGVNHFPPFLFATLRFLLVAIVLAPFLRINREMLSYWKPALAFCLMMGVGVYSTMYWSLSLANGASAILIGTQLATPIAVLIGVWLLAEKVLHRVWIGIALTMVGVFVVGFDTVILGYPMAFLLVIISASFYAGANVVSRFLRESSISTLNLNAWMALLSCPILLLFSFLSGEPWEQSIIEASWESWEALLYSSLVVSLIGHVGLFTMLNRYSIATIMPYYVFTPIFGILGAIILLDESLTARFIFGAVIAIVGLFIINAKKAN